MISIILQISYDPLFWGVLLYAILLGILHTALPCEDKAIFLFWSLGISKTAKRSILILILYGLGLIIANIIITTISIIIANIPLVLFNYYPDINTINLFGALSSITAALILLVLVLRGRYIPHAKRNNGQSPNKFNWMKLKTPLFFGILAGFAPCIFEFFIYSQAVQESLRRGFLGGFLYVLFFSMGTFIGLFPLALSKLVGSQIIKRKERDRSNITYIMTGLIILFNLIIIILSLLNITFISLEKVGPPDEPIELLSLLLFN